MEQIGRYFYKTLILISFLTLDAKNPVCISLGNSCAPALHLRNFNLRTEAYPFDWIVSPFDALYNALESDFRYFLSDLKIRPGNQGVIDYYGFHFTHDLPTVHQPQVDALNVDFIGNCELFEHWNQAVPLVKEKYRRRIERLRNVLHGKEKVYFIRWESNREEAVKLSNFFKIKYPNLDFTLVIFADSVDVQTPWLIDRVKNIFVRKWDDSVSWLSALKQVSSEFNDIRMVSRYIPIDSLICMDCLCRNL